MGVSASGGGDSGRRFPRQRLSDVLLSTGQIRRSPRGTANRRQMSAQQRKTGTKGQRRSAVVVVVVIVVIVVVVFVVVVVVVVFVDDAASVAITFGFFF